jgi:hypothetical protein
MLRNIPHDPKALLALSGRNILLMLHCCPKVGLGVCSLPRGGNGHNFFFPKGLSVWQCGNWLRTPSTFPRSGCIQQGSSVSALVQDTCEPVCIRDSTSVLGSNHYCYCSHVFLHIPGLGQAKSILLFMFYYSLDTCTSWTSILELCPRKSNMP